jgi:XTP/dITP diphosphohydrolase
LSRYLLEETYEALEAMDSGDVPSLKEELGDLLLQVVFHARIAQETAPDFTLDEIAQGVVDKLVRRHPHVFTDLEVTTNEELEDNWAAIKAAEKPRESVTDGVPSAMPALQVATQLMYRSRKMGVSAGNPELTEQLRTLVGDIDEQGIEDLLISVVALAREKDLDPESILRAAMVNYRKEIRTAEGL